MINLLLSLWLALSFSAKSVPEHPFDYCITTEIGKQDDFYMELSKQRQAGYEFYSHYVWLQQEVSFLQLKEMWQYYDSNDIKGITLRVPYKTLHAGIKQEWYNNTPETSFVAGTDFRKQVWKLLSIESRNDFFTSDFVNYYTDNSIKLSVDLYIFDVFWKSRIVRREFSEWNVKVGIQYEL